MEPKAAESWLVAAGGITYLYNNQPNLYLWAGKHYAGYFTGRYRFFTHGADVEKYLSFFIKYLNLLL